MILKCLFVPAKIVAIAYIYLSPAFTSVAQVEEGPSAQVYSGGIPISRPNIETIEFSPDLMIYPGETIAIVTSGSANVNQYNYERRRCKWAGLKCWYEKKSRTQVRSADHFDVKIGLFDRASNLVGGEQSIPTDPAIGGGTITLTNPLEGSFVRPLEVRAYIAKFGSTEIHRSNCTNRPQHCSSGELRLSVTTEVKNRREHLAARLDNYSDGIVPSAKIMSRDFIDPVLIDTPERKRQVQIILADRIPGWVDKAPKSAQVPLVDLIEFALPLSADAANRTKLIDARMAAFGKSGDYDSQAAVSAQAVKERSANCTPQSCEVVDAQNLVNALKNLSTATTEGSVRNRLSDITLSVGMLQQGADTLEKALAGKKIGDYVETLKELSNIYQSLSDKLMLIRTPAEIAMAVDSMHRSVCIHRAILNPQIAADPFFIETLCPDPN